MQSLVSELSKYIIIIITAIYAYLGFIGFVNNDKKRSEKGRKNPEDFPQGFLCQKTVYEQQGYSKEVQEYAKKRNVVHGRNNALYERNHGLHDFKIVEYHQSEAD